MMKRRPTWMRTFTVTVVLGTSFAAVSQNSTSTLEEGFKQPPDSAKPRIWWHWMNGNVTKEGITADTEWMKRVGIAGLQMFDGNLGTPQFVDKRLVWMTPEWKDVFHHAASEADRLGLEMSMAASGGWSETAGPWVKPEAAMKKVVWSETYVQGPKKFAGLLPHPPSINSRFQNIPLPPDFSFPEEKDLPEAKPQLQIPPPPPDPTFYADTKVIAYRLPDGEIRMADLHPTVTSSSVGLDMAALTDGDVSKNVSLPYAENGKPAWIQFEFTQPFHARAFTIAAGEGSTFGGAAIPKGTAQASKDGTNWLTLVDLPGPGHVFSGFPVRTYSFPETTAKYYRVLFVPGPPSAFATMLGLPPVHEFKVAEIEFHCAPRVNHWQEKAAFANLLEYESTATPLAPSDQVIDLHHVVDLTSKMRTDGTFEWEVPAGKWAILRMGYSLTGEKNHPASPEATGYEVDKLSSKHVNDYVKTYVDMIAGALGPYFGKSFRYFLMDSWEANNQNWTENMIGDFQMQRGYDPTPYLPVLTGRVIESADVSDRFLWDFRRTIADLLAENHYGVAARYFRQRGVGLYAEAMGAGLPTVGDGLENKGRVDIPMGEFWVPLPGQKDTSEHPADLREAASAAHIYGKVIAGAESFTTMPFVPMWGESPFYLKPLADNAFALGINRIIFHEGAAQPFVDDRHKPGMTLGFFGQNYTRNVTWAEQGAAWDAYLARSSYLLQQGLFVGDLAYFYGEGAPITVPFWKEVHPAPPDGYAYDYVNSEVLLTRMSVKNGRLVLPDGMSYRLLVLPEDVDRLTLPVLQKLRDLIAAGATVVAPKPRQSPSLSGYPSADEEIRFIADEVWGSIDGKSATTHDYGQGKVYWGKSIPDVLAEAKTPPDFEHTRPQFDTNVVWIHRHFFDADIYFVANQNDRKEDLETSFRVVGKEAELWHHDTGVVEPAEYRIDNGRTIVPLHLDPDGSVFVLFRDRTSAQFRRLPHPTNRDLATIEGPWKITFPANWGAPGQIELDRLISWTDSSNVGVKYFSGTATYSTNIDVHPEWLDRGDKIMLDLGKVKEIAEVSVNGKPLNVILWKPPFVADVTDVVKPGSNHLDIKVTNLWPNRVIGDQQPSATRYAFTDYKPYKADSPLFESGLLGPVKLSSVSMH
jgi:alpha-L-rhamnosidase